MAKTNMEPIFFRVPSGDMKCFLFSSSPQLENLAVVLPGAGYSYREPLLRFAIQVLLKNDFSVLASDKVYGEDPKWRSIASEIEARKIVADDAIEFFNLVSERFPVALHTVVARSLGTYALASALEAGTAKPKPIVWQTPALGAMWASMRSCGIRGFGILGTADHYFNEAFANLPEEKIIVEGADRGMEVEGDPLRSIEILKEVTLATDKWLRASVNR
jgi:hypothetical protein